MIYNLYLAFGQLGIGALDSYQPANKVGKQPDVVESSPQLTNLRSRNGHLHTIVPDSVYYAH